MDPPLGKSPKSPRVIMPASREVSALAAGAEAQASIPETVLAFGDYLLFPERRQLLAGSKPVELGSRAFDVLLALVEAEGRLVSRDEILKRVWPKTTVEEHNIPVQIAAIRRALGDSRGMVKTDAGRGYRFTEVVRKIGAAPGQHARAAPHILSPTTNLPAGMSSLVGRETELVEVPELLETHRLVTLTGAGGIGKTHLALEVARRALALFSDGVWLVEFGPLTDAEIVPAAIARTLGVELGSYRSITEQIVATLHRKHVLLVFDSCEHVIGVAARTVEELLHGAPGLHVLATTQESLAAEGERVYRVSPLKIPATNVGCPAHAMAYSAVRLFTERAQAGDASFMLDENTSIAVSQICRRLDGIPLAIELAAACVTTIGVEVLASGIDGYFRLLTGGRRTALKRHQRLSAMLDWSYALLNPDERIVLHRIAIFSGTFTLDAAISVAADNDVQRAGAADHVARLVNKSLITLDARDPVSRFRLLDTTRAYAFAKLAESGELDVIAQRHAEYYRSLIERAAAGWRIELAADFAARYTPEIDNINAALHWTLQHPDYRELGVELAAACIPLWTYLSILGTCRDFIRLALSRLNSQTKPQLRQEMLLQSALAHSLIWSEGGFDAIWSASKRALEIAEQLDDTEYQLRALYFQWAYLLRSGDYSACLPIVERFHAIAEGKGDAARVITSVRIRGTTLHYCGDLAQARLSLECVLRRSAPSMLVRFGLDDRVAALAYLARVLWLQGLPSRAMRTAKLAVEEAEALNHVHSLCFAICAAGFAIAAMNGDLETAKDFTARLIGYAERHGLELWQADGRALKRWIAIQEGDPAARRLLIENALHDRNRTRVELRHPMFVEVVSDGLASVGRADDGLTLIENVIEASSGAKSNWRLPELLRLRAEFLLHHGAADAQTRAERDLTEAFELSRRQGARAWQLRVAMSWARLWRRRGQNDEALAVLAPAFEWFTEGFETADLIAAKTLLDALTKAR